MSFKDTPIQRKLMTILLLTSGAVLLLTCSAFFAYEFLTFRQTALRQLATQGEIIAANSTAALAFENEDDAKEILSALKAERHIVAACLYDNKGKLFSKYPADISDDTFPAAPEKDGYRLEFSYLAGFQPVVQGTKRLGTLYLKSDMGAMYERFRLYGLIVLLVIIGSFLLAYMLSRMLQDQISHPILALAETAKAISARRDYSVRATKLGNDELGLLTDAFNQMLTQIHEQDDALRESEARTRGVLDSVISAVFVTDADGKIVDWNGRAEKLFGWTRHEAMGLDFAETIIPPRHRQTQPAGMERFLADNQGPKRTIEMSVSRHDGSEFPAEISVNPLKTSGVVTFCGFITDITERLRAEELNRKNFELEGRNRQIQEASRIKSEFLANMSHELRTPLNGIIGFAEFLADGKPGPLNPKQAEYLGDILDSGRYLLRLVNDLLDLAKIEAGRMGLNPETFLLGDAINEVCAVAQPIARKKSIEVSVRLAPELQTVTLDQQKLKQVLYNLLSNAIKFNHEAGRVEVSAVRVDKDRFEISVKDTGIGIKPEDLKRLRLFREFEQLESGASRPYEGTGLGLALSRKLVEIQGGLIVVESEFGKGSTFKVILPRMSGAKS